LTIIYVSHKERIYGFFLLCFATSGKKYDSCLMLKLFSFGSNGYGVNVIWFA